MTFLIRLKIKKKRVKERSLKVIEFRYTTGDSWGLNLDLHLDTPVKKLHPGPISIVLAIGNEKNFKKIETTKYLLWCVI